MPAPLRPLLALVLLLVLGAGCSESEPLTEGSGPIQLGSEQDELGRIAREGASVDPDAPGSGITEAAPASGLDPNTNAEAAANSDSIPVPEIGTTAFAVVVAGASDPFDPILEETVDILDAEGYSTTITNCDVGAADAITMQPLTSFTVSVYATDQGSAERLAQRLAAIGLPGVIANITVQCP